MRKILSILALILVSSCSTSTDDNGNSNTTVVPFPPSSLTGNVISSTQIDLSWTDNSTNETGFKIERRTGSANYAAIGTVTQDILTFSDLGLTPNTTYTYRVYSYNSVGNSLTYSNEVTITTNNATSDSVTDVDGNVYQLVTICGRIWTKQNLNVSKYSDGTPIPQVQDPTQWANLTTGAWCYYNNDPANGSVYGKLYNWYAVMGIHNEASATSAALRKSLVPHGYYIPTDTDFTLLTDCLGGSTLAGGKMKSTGTIEANNGLWSAPNTGATNSTGFTGLPGGIRFSTGSFNSIGEVGNWWTSSLSSGSDSYVWFRSLHYQSGTITKNPNGKKIGYSIRFIKG